MAVNCEEDVLWLKIPMNNALRDDNTKNEVNKNRTRTSCTSHRIRGQRLSEL